MSDSKQTLYRKQPFQQHPGILINSDCTKSYFINRIFKEMHVLFFLLKKIPPN